MPRLFTSSLRTVQALPTTSLAMSSNPEARESGLYAPVVVWRFKASVADITTLKASFPSSPQSRQRLEHEWSKRNFLISSRMAKRYGRRSSNKQFPCWHFFLRNTRGRKFISNFAPGVLIMLPDPTLNRTLRDKAVQLRLAPR